MRRKPCKHIERWRMLDTSDKGYGNNGAFRVPYGKAILCIVMSDGGDWEHVSVHAVVESENRCPTWDEMDYIRRLVFRPSEWVMQLHAPSTQNINVHQHVLHMWRPSKADIPIPPRWMV